MGVERGIELATLVARLPAVTRVVGDTARRVGSVEVDSRAVRSGALFVALRGQEYDGHAFVPQAVRSGACAVVAERPYALSDVTLVQVADSRRALSAAAAAFYGDPSRALDVIGVTGTNGKTTTTRMVGAILDLAARPCGVIGTVGAALGPREWQLENTTPLPPELHRLLAAMREDGAAAVAMEVSSHALALNRVDDVRFRVAVLTNVTRDHLDFHQTLEAYTAAKRRLFSLAERCVLNVDDAYGARWASELRDRGEEPITYGTRAGATLVPSEIVVSSDGSSFTVNGQRYELRLRGRFNIWNALAAIGVAQLLGIDDAASARGLASLQRVPGRMERIRSGGIDVVIDYAHTPDALENALSSLRESVDGALAVVFGCGGDRDRGKRAEMGAIAARLADRLYITSDNPRSEEPQAIVDEIVAGIGSQRYAVELDRRRAIELAICEARPGDVVLVAGKGHETYQIVGERVLPFDDAVVARETLRLRSGQTPIRLGQAPGAPR
jgi:UDP-N-acetylmuramoyl-L-alanyl-D-glutamate--2,6-diaminopimelate ligase